MRSHVCFRLELPLPLSLVPGAEVEDLWHALSHQVMREPTDLVAHTRRIILCRDRRLVHRLPGALADLQQQITSRLLDEAGELGGVARRQPFQTAIRWWSRWRRRGTGR